MGQSGVGWLGRGEGGGEDDARAHQVTSQPSSADHQVSMLPEAHMLACPYVTTHPKNYLYCVLFQFILGCKEHFPAQRLLNVQQLSEERTF